MGTTREESCSSWGTESHDRGRRDASVGSSGPVSADPDLLFRLSEAAFHATRDVLFLTGTDGRILRCNPAAEEVFGLSQQEILGRLCWEVVHGTSEPPPVCSLCLRQEDASHKTIEHEVHGRFFQTEIVPLLDPSTGTPLGTAHILTDITARKQTEETLRTKASHLAALLETSRALVAHLDPGSLFQTIVDHAANLTTLGLAALHFIDDGALRLVASCPPFPPVFRGHLVPQPVGECPLIQRALSTRTPVVVEDTAKAELTPAERRMVEVLSVGSFAYVPLVDEDRSLGVLVVGSVGTPHPFSQGELDTLIGLADLASVRITGARLEKQLRTSEERFLRLSNFARHLVYRYELKPKRGFTYVSPAATPITGYTPEEHYADPDLGFKIVHPDDRPLLEAVTRGEIDPDQPLVLRWTKKDGSLIWTEQRNMLLYDDNGELVAIEGIARDITDRVDAEKALAESEERYRSLVELAPVAMAVIQHGNIVYANQAFLRLVDAASPEQVVGKEAAAFVAPEELEQARRRREKTLAGEPGLYPAEATWVRLDGTRIAVEITGVRLVYDGKPALHLIVIDRTAQKAAEQALAESQRRYLDLVEHSPMAIWVEQDEKLVFINQAGARLLGADSPEQLLGRNSLSFVAPERLPAARLRHDGTLAGKQGLYPAETTWVRLDGTRVEVEVNSALIDYKGRPALQIMASDITPRKQVERALREEQERLSRVAESFPGAICVFRQEPDGSAFFPYASPAVEALCGVSPRELAQSVEPLRARIHPADLRRVRASVVRAARDLTPWEAEFRYLHPTRGEIWLETHFVPSREPDGSTVCTGVVLDATLKKRAEEEQERTRAQLYQAQKMEAIGRLAGGVAHDFNNMLSVILGYGQSLLDRLPPDDPAREDLQEIVRAAERSAHLTQQLLALGRRQPARPETLDLSQVLAEMDPMLRRLLGEDIELSLMLSVEPSLVTIDRGQLQQVVMNLLVNAKDAMPQGGRITLRVKNVQLSDPVTRTELGLEEGPYVALSVTDTGHGIPESALPHIFEPFFTTKEAGVGTGLGLAVVDGIVRQSGGGITVRSKPGRGSTFEIYLPQASGSPRTAPGPVSEPTRGAGVQRRRHVLVVEDEGSLRGLFERMLGELGYQVTLAADGKEALSLCEKGLQPDVLLTDVVMPGMSGPALAARLLNRQPRLRVVFMSGYPDDAIDRHGGLDEEIPFLQKPVTMSSLSAVLRQVLADGPPETV